MGTSMRSARSTGRPDSFSASSSASAWRPGAREAVEDRAVGGVGPIQAGEEQAGHQVVGHELARAHDRVDLAPDLAAAGDLGAEQVAGGEDGHAEARASSGACVPLPAPGAPRRMATVMADPSATSG